MDEDFTHSFEELCAQPASSLVEAISILELLADFVLNDIHAMPPRDREWCCHRFVSSNAYRFNGQKSRKLVVEWLEKTDLLHKPWLVFLGGVLAEDVTSCTSHLRSSSMALNVISNVIWTYRFTEIGLVQVYLRLMYEYFAHAQITDQALAECITVEFVGFLYACVCGQPQEAHDWAEEEAERLARVALLVLVALNDQYMLHDCRGSHNLAFKLLGEHPSRFVETGSALVVLFNRCNEHEQNLKIFIAKFLYLVFTNPSTMDLLYTNDLDVLAEVLVRELDDLSPDAVDVLAMYLRLLNVMAQNSPLGQTHPEKSVKFTKILELILQSAVYLPADDRSEIERLANRCLAVKWLERCEDPVVRRRPPPPPPQSRQPPQLRQPPPPPPSRQPKHYAPSVVSLDSIDVVDHLRPRQPPPPPPRRRN